MNTKRTITEIEIALAHSCSFDFRRNIVVFSVNGWSGRYTMRAEREHRHC